MEKRNEMTYRNMAIGVMRQMRKDGVIENKFDSWYSVAYVAMINLANLCDEVKALREAIERKGEKE